MAIKRRNLELKIIPRILQSPFPTNLPPANDPGSPTPEYATTGQRIDLTVQLSRSVADHVRHRITDRDIAGLDAREDQLDAYEESERRRIKAAADAAAQASIWPCW